MSIRFSRRQCLLSTSLLAISVAPFRSLAQDPETEKIASRPVIGTPVTCRTIPLGQTGIRRVVTAIAADPRGEFLAAAGDDYKIRILRTSDLKVVRTLVEHGDLVRTLAFDPAGKQLVSAGNDGRLILWDREVGFRFIREVAGSPALAEVTFAPDGSGIAAVGFDREVFLLQDDEGQSVSLQCACQDLRAVRYRDDSAVLAVAGRCGTLHLFTAQPGSVNGIACTKPAYATLFFYPRATQQFAWRRMDLFRFLTQTEIRCCDGFAHQRANCLR